MTLIVADRVQETTLTTGTSDYTLLGAKTGFQSFGAVMANADTTYYAVTDGTNWEVGIGTYSTTGPTMARTTILASSNGGAAVSWAAGTKEIFLTYAAEKSVYLDESGDLSVDGTTFFVDAANNSVGIGTSSPDENLHVSSSSFTQIKIESTGAATDPELALTNDNGGASEWTLRLDKSDSDKFQLRYNNSAFLTAITSGNVGVGTASPTGLMHLYGSTTAGANTVLRVQNGNNDGESFLTFGDVDDVFIGGVQYDHTNDSMNLYVNNAYRMYITSAGDVGVGVASPSTKLDVAGTANATALSIGGTVITATAAELNYTDGVTSNIQTQLDAKAPIASPTFTGTASAPYFDATTGGFTAVAADTAALPSFTWSGDTDTGIFRVGANSIGFSTAATERFRVAANGAIGIGGANYGSSGQVLTSNGSTAAPSWQSGAPSTAEVAAATAGIAYGAVGSYLEGAWVGDGATLTQNSTIAGSSIYPGGVFANNTTADTVVSSGASLFGGSVLSGTWRVMGRSRSTATSTVRTFTTLFLRIS